MSCMRPSSRSCKVINPGHKAWVFTQRDGSSEGGRLKGLSLQDLQRRIQEQAEWALANVQPYCKLARHPHHPLAAPVIAQVSACIRVMP